MTSTGNVIRVKLSDGSVVQIANAGVGGEHEVAARSLLTDFSSALKGIVGFSRDLAEGLRQVTPDRASIEFGVKVKLDGDGLVSRICGVTSDADFKVTLEWGRA